MAVTTDIFESWLRPRTVVGRLLAREANEPFALSLLLTFLVLALIARLPSLARESFLEGGTPLAPRALAAAMALLATLPLWYLLAALGTLAVKLLVFFAKRLGRDFDMRSDYYSGRIALFWAALASVPAVLVLGLVQGMIGPGSAAAAIGVAVALAFLVFWVLGLTEAGKR
jgi:hypothetical protein